MAGPDGGGLVTAGLAAEWPPGEAAECCAAWPLPHAATSTAKAARAAAARAPRVDWPATVIEILSATDVPGSGGNILRRSRAHRKLPRRDRTSRLGGAGPGAAKPGATKRRWRLSSDDRGHGGFPHAPQVVILGQPGHPGPVPLAVPAARANRHEQAVTGLTGDAEALFGAPGPVVL